VTTSEIWHLFAGLGGLVLSLVVGISAWFLNNSMQHIMHTLSLLETRMENLAERVSKLEGQIGKKR
jgi:hypothetical protein